MAWTWNNRRSEEDRVCFSDEITREVCYSINVKNTVDVKLFRSPIEFHFKANNENISFYEMEEGDEIELFWQAINEPNHIRRYYSWFNREFLRFEYHFQ